MWSVFSAEGREPEGPGRASRSSSAHYGKVSLEARVSQGHGAGKHRVTRDPSAAFSCGTSLLCVGTLLPEAWTLLGSPVLWKCTPRPQAGAPLLRLDLLGSCVSAPVPWQTDKNLASQEDHATRAAELPARLQCLVAAPFPASPPEGGGLC